MFNKGHLCNNPTGMYASYVYNESTLLRKYTLGSCYFCRTPVNYTTMYISITVFFLFVIFKNLVVCCNKDDLDKIDSVHQEEPCSNKGGMCVIAPDCPDGLLTQDSGLCPSQQSDSVECCYGSSVKETRCRKLGGECKPLSELCHVRPVYQHATDCPEK
ncbi:U-scoloptoxin(19)-Sm1a [Cydia pomonella]|uniref:U-scoloptoxin(19)-Sm1a n=1 Tax=Cydia pomonella TaxID=82600 RepID=UPI002ADDE7E7|nr:U-scoloptoxin(19)-Sm1a [Cydia pomonella]